jgi:hypothetical protein
MNPTLWDYLFVTPDAYFRIFDLPTRFGLSQRFFFHAPAAFQQKSGFLLA